MDLTSPWIADYQHMFADDEDEVEDVVAGELSECEDDDKEAGVVAGQSRKLSASASARAGADEEGSGFMDLTSPDFSSVPAPSLSLSVVAAKRPAPAAAPAAAAARSPSAAQPPQRRKHQHHSKGYQARRLPDPLGCNRTKR